MVAVWRTDRSRNDQSSNAKLTPCLAPVTLPHSPSYPDLLDNQTLLVVHRLGKQQTYPGCSHRRSTNSTLTDFQEPGLGFLHKGTIEHQARVLPCHALVVQPISIGAWTS